MGDRLAELSPRRNIVVIADEAHRSQYGFATRVVKGDDGAHLVAGLAQHMRDSLPHASFIGFTGTPIELTDKNTRAVFGDYISVYDIQRAVEDGATVPIYYESRLAKLDLDEREQGPRSTPPSRSLTERRRGREERGSSRPSGRPSKRWSARPRSGSALVAADLVAHFEERLEAMLEGKALVVCMSRRICGRDVRRHRQAAARPGTTRTTTTRGAIKVVITGSAADPRELLRPHIRTKAAARAARRTASKTRPTPLKIVIVRDMWLTGFDAPCMHTLYVDKPMRGHNLMQAIARVNRVFGDKPGGLVVDYLGVATFLKEAMEHLRPAWRPRARPAIHPAGEGRRAMMLEKLEICRDFFHGLRLTASSLTGTPIERLQLLPAAQEHVFGLEDGRRSPREGGDRSW